MTKSGGFYSVLVLLTSILLKTVSLIRGQDTGSGVEPRREYNVVDFLWSGSGSGSGEDGIGTAWVTTTVFKTKVQTLLLPTPVLPELCSACGSVLCSACSSSDCLSSSCIPSSTPKTPSSISSSRPNKLVPHQRYWLVTVIKIDSPVPDIHIFEKRLEKIYQLAFHRQQEKHLRLDGTNETVFKRSPHPDDNKQVTVKMHHFRRHQDKGIMELIYSVTLSGSTVDAVAAAHDMNLVSDKEVSNELGYPILTKAEPYYKKPKSLELAEKSNIWLLILVAICITLLFLIITVFYIIFNKRKKNKEDMAKDELDAEQDRNTTPVMTATGHIDKKSNVSIGMKSGDRTVRNTGIGRPPSAAPRDNLAKQSTKSYSPSYLSMPSIRAFPRGDTIRPLDQMLERESGSTRSLSRHHSEVGDPGVIGPAVWNLHCHRISKLEREKERTSEWEGRAARRRFHELLDDAFSLFPSQSSSSDPLPPPPPYSNSVSRLQQTDEEEQDEAVKTVRAWEGREARPLSAGPFHKVEVEPTWMLADSSLRPSDAAAPLIQAIKQELDKFPSVPSSRIQ